VRGSRPQRSLYARAWRARLARRATSLSGWARQGALRVWRPLRAALRRQVGGGGIVRSPRVHRQVVADVTAGIVASGFSALGCIESPLKGATSGNTEFLAYFRRQAAGVEDTPDGDTRRL
jgi:hypothetical protein